ncbi:MAG: hypothetical protein ACETVM_03510 [Candidatus Bathyarchaeia archaeon]
MALQLLYARRPVQLYLEYGGPFSILMERTGFAFHSHPEIHNYIILDDGGYIIFEVPKRKLPEDAHYRPQALQPGLELHNFRTFV